MVLDKLSLDSRNAALKAIASGSGTLNVPGTSGTTSVIATIPHGQGVPEVIVTVNANFGAVYGGNRYVTAPFVTPDGRNAIDVYVDSTNVYIKATSSTSGAPEPARSYPYDYTILIP